MRVTLFSLELPILPKLPDHQPWTTTLTLAL